MSFIEVNDVRFSYEPEAADAREVLHGITLQIEQGEFVALLGHNGCGKSTVAKLLNGMLVPTGGKVLVGGIDTAEEARQLEVRSRVGLVQQNPDNQLVAGVVEEDVAFGPENLGVPPEEIRRRVDEALRAVDMYEFRESAPHKLSGGQKQRVAIAGVIAMEPSVLILDEPTAGLDPLGVEQVLSNIQAYHKAKNATVIVVSHSMEEMARTADRLVVIHEGKIPFQGTPTEVFAHGSTLEEMGLGIPQMTRVFNRLQAMGADIDPAVYTVGQAKAALLRALGKGAE